MPAPCLNCGRTHDRDSFYCRECSRTFGESLPDWIRRRSAIRAQRQRAPGRR